MINKCLNEYQQNTNKELSKKKKKKKKKKTMQDMKQELNEDIDILRKIKLNLGICKA
jgi:hypothetical protein